MFNTFYMLASIELLKGYSVWMLIGWVAKTLLALTQSTSQVRLLSFSCPSHLPNVYFLVNENLNKVNENWFVHYC